MPPRWEYLKFANLNNRCWLQANIGFASLDQRHEEVGSGPSCSYISAEIAEWLVDHHNEAPSEEEFEMLLRRGASQWSSTTLPGEQGSPSKAGKSLDLHTAVGKRHGRLSPGRGGAMEGCFYQGTLLTHALEDFDTMWGRLSAMGPGVRIVYFNDHFFVLLVRKGECYMLDSLGSRLCATNDRGYMIRFDGATQVFRRAGKGPRAPCPGTTPMQKCHDFIRHFWGDPVVKCVLERLKEARLAEGTSTKDDYAALEDLDMCVYPVTVSREEPVVGGSQLISDDMLSPQQGGLGARPEEERGVAADAQPGSGASADARSSQPQGRRGAEGEH